MLIAQGANDPRVKQAEAEQIVEALRGKGKEVDYLLFEDEGHGFSKMKNQIEGYSAVLRFLDKYLKEAPATQ
jgi:dipeptidyl aminopeptidase/acylaminoacyl peptidase